jgi:membrane-bound acyltransferase YfiQ involved in biofilm formation
MQTREVDGRRDETEEERLDRNLTELLNELRVALPGVQVLFAFLLGVPFTQRFAELTDFQEDVYYATLVCAAAATAFMIAPTAHHRIEFRLQDKRHIVFIANRFAIIGLSFLATAMTSVVLLITDVMFGGLATVIATTVAALTFGYLWYVIPIVRRAKRMAARRD